MPAERRGGGTKNEEKEGLSFVPSAVSGSAGWHEPTFMCDRRCRKEGRLQVLRHRSGNGGRRRKAACNKPL